jgi:hypothetical protein
MDSEKRGELNSMGSEQHGAERIVVRVRDEIFERVFAHGSARVFARIIERAVDRFDERISSCDIDLASTSQPRASLR